LISTEKIEQLDIVNFVSSRMINSLGHSFVFVYDCRDIVKRKVLDIVNQKKEMEIFLC